MGGLVNERAAVVLTVGDDVTPGKEGRHDQIAHEERGKIAAHLGDPWPDLGDDVM